MYVACNTYNHHWKRIEEHFINDKKFYLIPKGIIPSSQLQPTIWQVDHLLDTIDYAINSKKLNPWDFESIRIVDEHYISDYGWPNVLDGFFIRDKINIDILSIIKLPEGRKLKNKLIYEYNFRNEFTSLLKRIPSKLRYNLINIVNRNYW